MITLLTTSAKTRFTADETYTIYTAFIILMVDSPLISVRVVNVDWYLSEESKLPVVRIFGCTPAGQRSCLHLHGVRSCLLCSAGVFRGPFKYDDF